MSKLQTMVASLITLLSLAIVFYMICQILFFDEDYEYYEYRSNYGPLNSNNNLPEIKDVHFDWWKEGF